MKTAKFYVYRNLRTKNFSVRYKGKVIKRLNEFEMFDVEFTVNVIGRAKVLETKQKNVHAFVSSLKEPFEKHLKLDINEIVNNKITYNPYKTDKFMYKNEKIVKAKHVVFVNNGCYKLR